MCAMRVAELQDKQRRRACREAIPSAKSKDLMWKEASMVVPRRSQKEEEEEEGEEEIERGNKKGSRCRLNGIERDVKTSRRNGRGRPGDARCRGGCIEIRFTLPFNGSWQLDR